MSIRADSKKIIQYFLEKAIECGALNEFFPLQYAELAQVLNFKDEKYCRVCCQYLNRMNYININRSKYDEHLNISLNAPAIDFLETV